MKQDTPIRNVSDGGRKPSRRLKYEVCLLHTQDEQEVPEVVAKFKNYGDCLIFASVVSKAPVYYHEILIR